MGRWSQYDDDDARLPEGMTRIGYDADTQVYTYEDEKGDIWQGAPGNRYGRLHRAGRRRQRSPSPPVEPIPWLEPGEKGDDDEDGPSLMQRIVSPIQSLQRSLTEKLFSNETQPTEEKDTKTRYHTGWFPSSGLNTTISRTMTLGRRNGRSRPSVSQSEKRATHVQRDTQSLRDFLVNGEDPKRKPPWSPSWSASDESVKDSAKWKEMEEKHTVKRRATIDVAK